MNHSLPLPGFQLQCRDQAPRGRFWFPKCRSFPSPDRDDEEDCGFLFCQDSPPGVMNFGRPMTASSMHSKLMCLWKQSLDWPYGPG